MSIFPNYPSLNGEGFGRLCTPVLSLFAFQIPYVH